VLQDDDFGRLVFMHIRNNPSRSYWEGEWFFPLTRTNVSIALPGTVEGPVASGRAFYLSMPARFDRVIDQVRPILDRVFREWFGRPIAADLWSDVKLGGFDLEDPDGVPIAWDMGFESLGEKSLGITVPFLGEQPQEPTVDC
jgi:hypothetical protein